MQPGFVPGFGPPVTVTVIDVYRYPSPNAVKPVADTDAGYE